MSRHPQMEKKRCCENPSKRTRNRCSGKGPMKPLFCWKILWWAHTESDIQTCRRGKQCRCVSSRAKRVAGFPQGLLYFSLKGSSCSPVLFLQCVNSLALPRGPPPGMVPRIRENTVMQKRLNPPLPLFLCPPTPRSVRITKQWPVYLPHGGSDIR